MPRDEAEGGRLPAPSIQRVREMKTREFQTFLKHLLPTFRGSAKGCPDENALTAFLEAGEKGKRPDPALRRHVLRCPACMEKVLLLGKLTGSPAPLRARGYFERLWESPALRPALSGALVVLLAAAVYFGGVIPSFEKKVLEPSAPESALPAGAPSPAPNAPAESPAPATGITANAPGPAGAGERPRAPEAFFTPAAPPPFAPTREQGAPVPAAPAMADRVVGQAGPSPAPPPAPPVEKMKEEEAKRASTEAEEDNLTAFAPVPDRPAVAGARPEPAPYRGAEGASRTVSPAAASAPPVSKAAVSRPPASPPPAPPAQPPGAPSATITGGRAGNAAEYARAKGQAERQDETDLDGKPDDALRRLLERLCPKARASSVRYEWRGRTCYAAEGYLVESGLCDREIRDIRRRSLPRESSDRKDNETRRFRGVFVAEGNSVVLYVE